jgi:SAM-dependent methyltransferase
MAHTLTRSYSSGHVSVSASLREARNLYRSYSGNIPEKVRASIADVRRVESLVADRLGLDLHNKDILEIGPGQFLSQMKCFSVHNQVVGIDLEVIPQHLDARSYLKMIRMNGLRRTTKTLGRKLLGIDRRYASELTRQLNLKNGQELKVLQMDACSLQFSDSSFDFVYSRSVFHHLSDPAAAIDGIVRVLKPGGAVYILLHLYTSETGCLDPRIYTDRRSEVLGWPHLRSQQNERLDNQGTYVNKLRLGDWHALFHSKMPGADLLMNRSDDATIGAAQSLQAQGELLDYSIEELTTVDLAVIWRKPPFAGSLEP